MHIASMLVVGLVIGVVSRLVMPAAAGWYGTNESAGVVATVVGATVLIRAYRRIA